MAFRFTTKNSTKENSTENLSKKKTPLNNSMDGISVSYGVSFTEEERFSIRHGKNKKRVEALKSKIKTVTVPQFIYPEKYGLELNLSDTEQKIQTALQKVYEVNGKDPPLYEKFPTFRSDTQPLTIDITTAGLGKDCSASYDSDYNIIEFVEIDNPISLVSSIAHELKHAENATEEVQKLKKTLEVNNNYGLHQLEFLNEASAYACGALASYKTGEFLDNNPYKYWYDRYTENGWSWREEEVREMEIRTSLGWLYDSSYKDKYDSFYPIGENDEGLDHIPEIFHISEERTIKTLKEAPRLARTAENRFKQLKLNNKYQESIELIFDALSKGEKIDFDMQYLIEHCPTEQIGKIFDLRMPDGKPLIDKETLLSLFAEYMNGKPPKEMGKNFQELVNYTDITSKDCREKNLLRFADGLALNDFPNLVSRLPVIATLRGKDGKPLVSEKQLGENLREWLQTCEGCKTVSGSKSLLECLLDKNGHLPIDRELFDLHTIYGIYGEQTQVENLLLRYRLDEYSLVSEKNKKEAFDLMFWYMSLKDKNGKPIISPENIQAIPKKNLTLISAIKAYKRQQFKGRLKRLFSFASKLRPNQGNGNLLNTLKNISRSPKTTSPVTVKAVAESKTKEH